MRYRCLLCLKLLRKYINLNLHKDNPNRYAETIIKIVLQLYMLKSKDNIVDNYNDDETRVYSSYHPSQFDRALLNEAIQKAIEDKDFMNSSLNLLTDAKFPIYKNKIIEHVQQLTNDKLTIALFQTLSDTLEYKNIEQIRNIFLGNIPAKNSPSRTKSAEELNVNPLTTKPNQKSPKSDNNESISDDTMREYICNKCGKSFLTGEDLHIHQKFEMKDIV
jgi:hypothetical protein